MSDGLTFRGVNEFLADINDVANTFPLESEKRIKRIGNKFKNIAKQKSPDSGHNSRKKLNKSWKSEVTGYKGEDLACNIWSTSPHFHLVDRGHVQKSKRGKITGFVQGKHFLEATAQEVEKNILPAELEKFCKEITKKLER